MPKNDDYVIYVRWQDTKYYWTGKSWSDVLPPRVYTRRAVNMGMAALVDNKELFEAFGGMPPRCEKWEDRHKIEDK